MSLKVTVQLKVLEYGGETQDSPWQFLSKKVCVYIYVCNLGELSRLAEMAQDWGKVKKRGCENKGWEKQKKPRLQTRMRRKQRLGTETEKWEVENTVGRNKVENRRQMERMENENKIIIFVV